eukprot:7032874-Alexandrium_andersonii.AAC.1
MGALRPAALLRLRRLLWRLHRRLSLLLWPVPGVRSPSPLCAQCALALAGIRSTAAVCGVAGPANCL